MGLGDAVGNGETWRRFALLPSVSVFDIHIASGLGRAEKPEESFCRA